MDKEKIVRIIKLSDEWRCIILRKYIDDGDGFPQEIVTYRYDECGQTDYEIYCSCTGGSKRDWYCTAVRYPDYKELTSTDAHEIEAVDAFNAHLLYKDKVSKLKNNMMIGE